MTKKRDAIYFMGDIECNNPNSLEDQVALFNHWKTTGYRNFAFGGFMSFKKWSNKPYRYWLFVDQFEMWNWLVEQADLSKTNKVIVFFHNLKFDAPFFFNPILKSGAVPVFGLFGQRLKDNQWSIFYQTSGNTRILRIKVKLKGKAMIVFRCSFQLLPYSIEELGKLLGVPKLSYSFNYDKQRNYKKVSDILINEEVYLQRDLYIGILALKDKTLRKQFGGALYNATVSSAVFKQMKRACELIQKKIKLKQHPLIDYMWNDADIDFSFGRAGYQGGLSNGHQEKWNIIFEDVYYTDIISSFPSAMVKDLPAQRNSKFCYRNSGRKCVHYLKLFMPKGKLKKNMPCGIVHRDSVWDRTRDCEMTDIFVDLYPYDVFHVKQIMVKWEEELLEIKKWYDFDGDIIVLETYHFLMGEPENRIIQPFIEEMFEEKNFIKQKMKAKPNNLLLQRAYQVSKARINSTYGQLGMNDSVQRLLLVLNKNKLSGNDVRLQEGGKYIWVNKDIEEVKLRKDIFKASYITMKKRVVLMKTVRINKDYIIYFDTDCMFTSKRPVLPPGERFGEGLGDWSNPVVWPYFKATAPKHYIGVNEKNKLVIRGGGTTIKELTEFFNQQYKNHNFHCLMFNFNKNNIGSFKKLKHVWYEWGSCLIRFNSNSSYQWNCKCWR